MAALFGLCLDNRVTKGEGGKGGWAAGSRIQASQIVTRFPGCAHISWLSGLYLAYTKLYRMGLSFPTPKTLGRKQLVFPGLSFLSYLNKKQESGISCKFSESEPPRTKEECRWFANATKNTYAHPSFPGHLRGSESLHSLHWALVKLTCNLTKSRTPLLLYPGVQAHPENASHPHPPAHLETGKII